MNPAQFDESNITWHRLEGIDHVQYHVYDVDVERQIVDVLLKFDANEKVVLHRHHADYCTVVLQGELRLYTPKGDLKEIRPIGSYVTGKAGGEPHTEGGGDVDAIVFFSNRGTDGVIYQILDEDMNEVGTLGLHDFKDMMEAQNPAPYKKAAA